MRCRNSLARIRLFLILFAPTALGENHSRFSPCRLSWSVVHLYFALGFTRLVAGRGSHLGMVVIRRSGFGSVRNGNRELSAGVARQTSSGFFLVASTSGFLGAGYLDGRSNWPEDPVAGRILHLGR